MLAEPHDGPTVVITHHAPSTSSIHPRVVGSRNPRGYARAGVNENAFFDPELVVDVG
jgi:hypothetical protein